MRRLLLTSMLLTLMTSLASAEPFGDVIRRFRADARSVRGFWSQQYSASWVDKQEQLLTRWQKTLQDIDTSKLDRDAQVDYRLLRHHLESEISQLNGRKKDAALVARLLPESKDIWELHQSGWRDDSPPARDVAATLSKLAEKISARQKELSKREDKQDKAKKSKSKISDKDRRVLRSATSNLRYSLKSWTNNRGAFEPGFNWWVRKPSEELDSALEKLAKGLEVKPEAGKLRGEAIGRERLIQAIHDEMLPYTPEELLEIADKEFAWCQDEQKKAAKEMGFGDRWKDALEKVKGLHVDPGQQAALVVQQAEDVIKFLDDRDLITVPDLCRQTWRYRMLNEKDQRNLPYAAYSSQQVMVASPTEAMSHASKLMSMRGNNIHFTRIVTPHELIPGHHLQRYMADRYNTQRQMFSTPFYVEGWALYWEMRLWDLDYPRGPEDRLGMLFWRMHRCARIIVSLRFHLGEMSPEEMVEFLVERVGHERDGATSEVRRYIGPSYGPLYQAAYMLGGLQLYALQRETVGAGKMTDKQFHDRVLKESSIPIELIRARLLEHDLGETWKPAWRFYSGQVKRRRDL